MSIINTEYSSRMLAVADLIEVRDRFDYSCWYGTVDEECLPDDPGVVALDTKCNLVGCIGGWAVTWALGAGIVTTAHVKARAVGNVAADVLGLTPDQADALFLGGAMVKLGWYESRDLALSRATATEAAKMLRGIAVGEYDIDDLTEPLDGTL